MGDARTMWQYCNLPGSYRHWNQFFPVRRGAHQPGHISRIPYGAPLGTLTHAFGEEKRTLDDYITRARTTGLIELLADPVDQYVAELTESP